MDGLHDPDSPLNMLRWPNEVRSPAMEIIWEKLTEDWQVLLLPQHQFCHRRDLIIDFIIEIKTNVIYISMIQHVRCSTKEVLLI